MSLLTTSRPNGARTLLAAFVLLLAGAVVAPVPAQATTSSTCPAGYLCLYYNSGFTGARADLVFSDAALNNEVFNDGPRGRAGWGQTVGNDSASLWNRTGTTVRLYNWQGCTSRAGNPTFSVVPGGKVNLGDIGWKNKISSLYIEGRGQCVPYSQAHL